MKVKAVLIAEKSLVTNLVSEVDELASTVLLLSYNSEKARM